MTDTHDVCGKAEWVTPASPVRGNYTIKPILGQAVKGNSFYLVLLWDWEARLKNWDPAPPSSRRWLSPPVLGEAPRLRNGKEELPDGKWKFQSVKSRRSPAAIPASPNLIQRVTGALLIYVDTWWVGFSAMHFPTLIQQETHTSGKERFTEEPVCTYLLFPVCATSRLCHIVPKSSVLEIFLSSSTT